MKWFGLVIILACLTGLGWRFRHLLTLLKPKAQTEVKVKKPGGRWFYRIVTVFLIGMMIFHWQSFASRGDEFLRWVQGEKVFRYQMLSQSKTPQATAPKPVVVYHSGVTAKPFGPLVEVVLPVSPQPVWRFAGLLPPGKYSVRTNIIPQVATAATFYLVDGGMVGSQPQTTAALDSLHKDHTERLRKDRLAVGAATKLPPTAFKTFLNGNNGATVTALYVQCSDTDVPYRVNCDVEDPTVKHELLAVDRDGGISFERSDEVWLVPIYDPTYQSKLFDQPVPITGWNEEQLKEAARAFVRLHGGNATVVSQSEAAAADAWQSQRPQAEELYQALMIDTGEGPRVFSHPVVLRGSGTVRLFLNATSQDTLAKASQPYQVLVGSRRSR